MISGQGFDANMITAVGRQRTPEATGARTWPRANQILIGSSLELSFSIGLLWRCFGNHKLIIHGDDAFDIGNGFLDPLF